MSKQIRRTLALSLMLILGWAQSTFARSFTFSEINIIPGQTSEFYVYLSSSYRQIVSFQMDLILPAGLTVNTEKCALTERVTDKEQQLYIGKVADNTYRLVSTSFSLTTLPPLYNTLLKISVTADKSFKGGNVVIDNLIGVSSNGVKNTWTRLSQAVKVQEGLTGDVNLDGVVDVKDSMLIVEYMLSAGDKPYTTQMDVNKDGKVDVTDVMLVVNLILKTEK